MDKDIESFHAKFRSGNSIQVDRATILRSEYEAVCEEIKHIILQVEAGFSQEDIILHLKNLINL